MILMETVLHRWFRIPYALHANINRRPSRGKTPTILFIHGIGNSGDAWNEVIATLPSDLGLATIDLLGFGRSPRPAWAVYDAKTQARSVVASFLKLRITSPVIIVGHSLGALVAVEVAKRYPFLVRSLILCSPPFYKMDEELRGVLPKSDAMLRHMFTYSKNHPEYMVRVSELAVKYRLVNPTFQLTHDNVDIYMAALESCIINQTSLNDTYHLHKRIVILRGQFDPVVIKRNLRELAEKHKRVTLINVLGAGHEVRGRFVPAVVRAIENETAIDHPGRP
jgi:pimeloyl-ACP methyl ester carboxylesterase